MDWTMWAFVNAQSNAGSSRWPNAWLSPKSRDFLSLCPSATHFWWWRRFSLEVHPPGTQDSEFVTQSHSKGIVFPALSPMPWEMAGLLGTYTYLPIIISCHCPILALSSTREEKPTCLLLQTVSWVAAIKQSSMAVSPQGEWYCTIARGGKCWHAMQVYPPRHTDRYCLKGCKQWAHLDNRFPVSSEVLDSFLDVHPWCQAKIEMERARTALTRPC